MWFIDKMTYDMAKHLALLGVIVLVGFAYSYFGPINEMDLIVTELQVEVDSTEGQLEDASLTNAEKVNLLKANIRKADLVGKMSQKLLIYQIVAGVFVLGGIVMMKLGFWRMYTAKD